MTKLYCYKCPNGDVSIVTGRDAMRASLAFDELMTIDPADVHEFTERDFFLTLRCDGDGRIVLAPESQQSETAQRVLDDWFPTRRDDDGGAA